MICKYCGKESDNGSEICSVCRDMLGVDEPAENSGYVEQPIEIEPEIFIPPSKEKKMKKAKKEKAPKEPKTPKKPVDPAEKRDLIPVIALVMCVICLVVAVSAVYSAVKMRADLGEAVKFANEAQAQRIADLDGRLAAIEKVFAEEEAAKKAAEEAEKKNFKIVKAPSDESQALGYKSQTDHYLFGLIVEGSVQSFSWEKQLADGSYIPVAFDENGRNLDFGIYKLESITEGYSKLVADGLTIQAAGTYRCTAVSTFGDKLEASVVLEITQ